MVAHRKNSQECARLMSVFGSVCLELGTPLAHEKTIGPTIDLVFLGLKIESVTMTMYIWTN